MIGVATIDDDQHHQNDLYDNYDEVVMVVIMIMIMMRSLSFGGW